MTHRISVHILISLFLASIAIAMMILPTTVLGAENAECLAQRNLSGIPFCQSVDVGKLGFRIPTLGDLMTFAVRGFFAIAGIAALFYMLIGAFGWVTSGGDKDSITAARERIQAAVIGMILIVAVLAIIWTLEQIVFKRRICLGLSCTLTIPGLVENIPNEKFCCSCATPDGNMGEAIDAFKAKCNPAGQGVPF